MSSKQEEIKQEMGQWVLRIRQYLLNTEFCPEPFTKPVDIDVLKNKFPDEILSYLHSMNVVIKVERELRPILRGRKMKLLKMKEVIDQSVKAAEKTNPNIEFWIGNTEYELKDIGQFGVIPDVVITLKSNASYEATMPLIKKGGQNGKVVPAE